MFPCLYVEVVWSLWRMGTRFGLVSSMNDCLISVIGVVRIVCYRFKAKVPCLLTSDNMVKVYVCPYIDPITNLWFLSLVITIKWTIFKEEDDQERWWLNRESGGC